MAAVSLWADVNCDGSPNLKTEFLLWTMALAESLLRVLHPQMTFSYHLFIC